jgi:hypothetical protein
MHGPTEADHGVIAEGIRRRRRGFSDEPLVERRIRRQCRVGEDADAGVALLADRKHTHGAILATIALSRRDRAFAAERGGAIGCRDGRFVFSLRQGRTDHRRGARHRL